MERRGLTGALGMHGEEESRRLGGEAGAYTEVGREEEASGGGYWGYGG